jgi:hypothetical protein
MPQINQALRHFYRKHPESVEISLEAIGVSQRETKPTVLVVCTSVAKVRAILKRKLGILFDGTTGFALKVCRGQVLRSRNRRSMAKSQENEDDLISALNVGHQERPENGASIGAWMRDKHLPPVSFGGLVMIDDKPYGMTVHHMLDDPEDEEPSANKGQNFRSSDRNADFEEMSQNLLDWYAEQQASWSSESSDGEWACEFSDTESVSESDITSDASDDEESEVGEDEDGAEPGDLPGIEPGFGDGIYITQPALDDVDEDFYPNPASQDEDHLSSYSLGEVYASSGIRRRSDANGLVHEIDWALFEFHNERLPDRNSIPRPGEKPAKSLQPTAIAPTTELPGLEVQCIARTSGLQTGHILPTLTSVKIYGRASASHTYQIRGSLPKHAASKRVLPMGIPGDSGAWIVDRAGGRLCGHVLAWSARKKVAYLCPMEVLLLDIAETLSAGEVRLPGGETLVKITSHGRRERRKKESSDEEEHEDEADDDGDEDLGDLVLSGDEDDDGDEEHGRVPGYKEVEKEDEEHGRVPEYDAGKNQSRGFQRPAGDKVIAEGMAQMRLGSGGVETC